MDLEIEREVLNADISLKTSLWSWWEESPKRAISSTSSNVMKWDLKPKMVASQQALHQAEKDQSPDWPGAVRKLQTQEMKPRMHLIWGLMMEKAKPFTYSGQLWCHRLSSRPQGLPESWSAGPPCGGSASSGSVAYRPRSLLTRSFHPVSETKNQKFCDWSKQGPLISL